MDVTIIASMDPYALKMGGIKIYAHNLYKHLINLGVKVRIIGFESVDRSPTKSYCTFTPIGKNLKSENSFLIHLFLKGAFLNIPKYSIIHLQRPEYALPFLLFNRTNYVVCTLHGVASKTIKLKKSFLVMYLYEVVEHLSFKRINSFIAVDEDTKQYYEQKYPFVRDKIRLLNTAIDLDYFTSLNRELLKSKYAFKSHDKIVEFVGRLEKEKNIDMIIKSFALIKDPNIKLIIIGDGRERKNLEMLADRYGKSNIIFWGPVDSNKVPELLNCADLFVLTSIHEGSPTIIKEALACGVPILSTNVGDVPKIISSEDYGIIIDRVDPQELAKKITYALNKDWDRVKISNYGKQFGWNHMVLKILNLYKRSLLPSRGS